MKIVIFTGATSVRSKNIFTDISRYPTGKHEIKTFLSFQMMFSKAVFILKVKMIEVFDNSVTNDQFLDWSKLKVFADDKMNVTEKLKFVWERSEKIGYQHFLLSSQCF